MNQQAETNTAIPEAGYHSLGYDPTVAVQTPAPPHTQRRFPRGIHISFPNGEVMGLNDPRINVSGNGLRGLDLTALERVEFNNTGPGQMTINSGQFATHQPMGMPGFGVPAGSTNDQMVPANCTFDAQMGNCCGPPQPLMGMLPPQGQQGQNSINSTPMPGPVGVTQGNQPSIGAPFPSPSRQHQYSAWSISLNGRPATTIPMANTPNQMMNVIYVPPEQPQGYSTNYTAAHPAPAAPTFHTGYPGPNASAHNNLSLAVSANTPTRISRTPPFAYPVPVSGPRVRNTGFSGARPSRTAGQVEATVGKTPTVVGEHKKGVLDLLQVVYRKGMRRSMQEAFDRLRVEMHMTGRLFGQQLEQGGEQRATAYMTHLMGGIVTQLTDMPDAVQEVAQILANFDDARFAAPASALNVPSRHSEVNSSEGRVGKPETVVTPAAALPAGSRIRKRNAKSTQKGGAKRAQNTSKAAPSPPNKAKGKDERDYTLDERTRILMVDGEKCVSHHCSDGQWRLLQGERLEEAQKRTVALKVNSTANTPGAGVKRESEADDDGQAKKVKLTVQEITPSTTVSQRTSSDREGIATLLGVSGIGQEAQGKQIFPASEDCVNVGVGDNRAEEEAQCDQVFPAGEHSVTVGLGDKLIGQEAQGDQIFPASVFPASEESVNVGLEGNRPGEEAQDAQPPLTVELAERNYLQNVAFLNSVSLDMPLDVGPIPPVPTPIDAAPTGEGQVELNVMWLGQQMQNIKSSFG
ncbi:hypothetical protein TARUN_2346 [Trichoderma arundinaceum]|uniref:Uncharacterized protein n=1 Tax=Trichoderma arundinaceum TaxID=490622 RepID=A0A395NVL2_TRIAR|nr:hypothetical protein TARUN_2346 [Trichoderma arundinaceum]